MRTKPVETLYDQLGVEKNATTEEIHKAYREKARQYHPDNGGNKEDFINLKKIHDILCNNEKRAEYDRTGNVPGEEKKLTPEMEALQMVGNGFEDLLHQMKTKVVHTDYLKAMKDALREAMKHGEKTNKDLADIKAAFEQALRNLKAANGRGILEACFKKALGELEHAMKKNAFEMEAMKVALEILGEYKYKHKLPKAPEVAEEEKPKNPLEDLLK